MSQKQYLIIGDGRMAKHFSHYLGLLQIPHDSWTKKTSPELLQIKAHTATHILLLITDSQIEAFYKAHLAHHIQKCILHFSGALEVPGIVGIHPLMTFGPDLYDLPTYKKIHFVATSDRPINDLLPGLHNPCHILPKNQKSLYHALCVFSGNFTTLLWQEAFREFEKLGISQEALVPYLDQTISNLKKNSNAALTGPLARKDALTVSQNLQALNGHKGQAIYTAFVQTYFPEYKGPFHENK